MSTDPTKAVVKATPLVTLVQIQPTIDTLKNQLITDFQFEATPIENDEQELIISEFGSKLNKRIKEIESHQKAFTKPLNDEKTAIIKEFKDALEHANLVMKQIRKVKGEYAEKKMAEADQLLIDAKEADPQAVVEIPKTNVKTKEGSSSVSFKWYGEVIDKSLIPREYLTVNESMINQTISASKGVACIPGVKNKKKPITSFR